MAGKRAYAKRSFHRDGLANIDMNYVLELHALYNCAASIMMAVLRDQYYVLSGEEYVPTIPAKDHSPGFV